MASRRQQPQLDVHDESDETEESAPESQAQLNRLSCFYCKSRKLKCDRRMPTCGRCREYEKDCVFPRHRASNIGKKKQVRDLEAKLAQVEDQIKDLNDKYDQLSSPASLPLARHLANSGPPGSRTVSLQPSTPSGNVVPPVPCPEIIATHEPQAVSLPHNDLRDELTRLYFERFLHAAPFIHPQRYLDSLHAEPSEQPPKCLQLIIMAMAAAIHPSHVSQAKGFYIQARAAAEQDEMEDVGQHFVTRRHVQTWHLMSYFEAQNAMFTRASTSIMQAIRIAQFLNLHQLGESPEESGMDWVDYEESRRVWWLAFVSDRLIFTTTGIPVVINVRDIKTPLPASEEAFFDMQIEPTRTLYEALKQPQLGISPLAARVLVAELFYQSISTMSASTCKAVGRDPLHESCRPNYQEIESRLVLLSASLPQSLRLPGSSRAQHAIFVNVLIQTATICLHKALLQLGQQEGSGMNETDLRRSRDRIVTAAREMIHIFSLSDDLQVALRNPIICFTAYTAGLVFLEMAVREGNESDGDSVLFLLNMLNAVAPTHPVAAMLVGHLSDHASNLGLQLPTPDQVPPDEPYRAASRDFAEQLAAFFGV